MVGEDQKGNYENIETLRAETDILTKELEKKDKLLRDLLEEHKRLEDLERKYTEKLLSLISSG